MKEPDRPTSEPASPEAVGAASMNGRGAAGSWALRLWVLSLAGGLLAGFVSWRAGESSYGHFKNPFVKPADWGKMNGYERDNFRSSFEIKQRPSEESRNVALTFGVLGAALGVAMGLAGGLARGSLTRGLTGAVAGAGVGGFAAALASFGAVPVFYKYLDPEMGLAVPALTHLVLFAAVGLGGGLGMGAGLGARGSLVRGIIGGVLGGMAGAAANVLAVALVFSDMRVYDPIPRDLSVHQTMPVPRLVMHLSAALFVSILAPLCIQTGQSAGRSVKSMT